MTMMMVMMMMIMVVLMMIMKLNGAKRNHNNEMAIWFVVSFFVRMTMM